MIAVAKSKQVSIARLHELFEYRDGLLIWKISKTSRAQAGDIAGTRASNGYIHVRFDGRVYLRARIVFAMAHGHWPANNIDHINGIRDDDRFENLRDIGHRQNCQNLPRHRAGQLVGASYDQRREKWLCSFHLMGRTKNIGYFNSELEAHRAYLKEMEKLSNG